jgi:GNAT superfamily N-acetyltransferase
MHNITITQINASAPEFSQLWDLREEVLRKPLGRSLKDDDLSRDYTDVIFIAKDNSRVIGCVLLHHLDPGTAQLRAMAVYPGYQGKNIGRQLVQAFEQYAWKAGYNKIILHARKVALGFYAAMGYSVTSDEFIEVGIPHYMMEKRDNQNTV